MQPILITAEELKLAERIGRKAASSWSAVDQDDVISHLNLWLVENLQTVQKWRAEEAGQGKLFVSLRREASKFAAKEQAAATANPLNMDSFYTTQRIEAVLPFVFDEWPQSQVRVNPVTGEPVDGTDHTLIGEALAVLADVSGAFHGLNREMKEVLYWRFRDGLTFQEIGELSGMTKVGAKKRVDRAVKRLQETLSGIRRL